MFKYFPFIDPLLNDRSEILSSYRFDYENKFDIFYNFLIKNFKFNMDT